MRWGVLAMEKFSAAFESTPVTGATGIRYGSQARKIVWPLESNSKQVDLPWQDGTRVARRHPRRRRTRRG